MKTPSVEIAVMAARRFCGCKACTDRTKEFGQYAPVRADSCLAAELLRSILAGDVTVREEP